MRRRPDQEAVGGTRRCPVPKTARRLGVAAFAFFLIKGLVWLGLAGAAALGLMW